MPDLESGQEPRSPGRGVRRKRLAGKWPSKKERGSGNTGTSRSKLTTGLQLDYVLSLPALGPFDDIKGDSITLVERFEPFSQNG